jgi:hypothetical protein
LGIAVRVRFHVDVAVQIEIGDAFVGERYGASRHIVAGSHKFSIAEDRAFGAARRVTIGAHLRFAPRMCLSLAVDLALHVDLRLASSETTLLAVLVATRVDERFAPDVALPITSGFAATFALLWILSIGTVVLTDAAAFDKTIVIAGDVLTRVALLLTKRLTIAGATHAHIEIASPLAPHV